MSTLQIIRWLALIAACVNCEITAQPPFLNPVSIRVNQSVGTNFTFTAGVAPLVRIESSTPGATIFYVLDGSRPTPASKLYEGPFSVTTNSVIRALAIFSDFSEAESPLVTISFEGEVALEIRTIGNGTVTRDPNRAGYPLGEQVILTAIPAAYHRFVEWENGSAERSRTVLIGPTNRYTATFTNTVPIEEQLTFLWEKEIPPFYTLGTVYPWSVLPINGDFVMSGTEYSGGNSEGFISRLSKEGELLWRKLQTAFVRELFRSPSGFVIAGADGLSPYVSFTGFSGDGVQRFDQLHGMEGQQGQVAITSSPENDAYFLVRDQAVALISSEGDLLWRRADPSLSSTLALKAFNVRDGYLLLAIRRSVVDLSLGPWEAVFYKFDLQGNLERESLLDVGESLQPPSDASMLPDGRIAVLWVNESGSSRLAVFTETGSRSWMRVFEGYLPQRLYEHLAVSESGQIWIGGFEQRYDPLLGHQPEPRFLSLSPDGELFADAYLAEPTWRRTTGGSLNLTVGPDSLLATTGGNFITAVKLERKVVPRGTPMIFVNDALPRPRVFTNRLNITIRIESHLAGTEIFYTLDGTTNRAAAIRYRGPFQLGNSAVLRAISAAPDGSEYYSEPQNIVIEPNFELVTKTRGGGQIFGAARYYGQSVFPSNTVATVHAVPQPGFSFLEWRGDLTGNSNPASILMNGTRNVEAVFGTSVKMSVTGEGRIVQFPMLRTNVLWAGSEPVAYGTEVQFTAIPKPTHYFALWGKSVSGTSNTIGMRVATPQPEVAALFAPLGNGEVALTAFPNGRGSVQITPAQKTYKLGERVTLKAIPLPAQNFFGWSGDIESDQEEIVVELDRSMVLAANFRGGHPEFLKTHVYMDIAGTDYKKVVLFAPVGARYEVEVSSDLKIWTLSSSGVATNGFVELQNINLSEPRFFRLSK